eukprot:3061587-Prymnesium_polylepis.1
MSMSIVHVAPCPSLAMCHTIMDPLLPPVHLTRMLLAILPHSGGASARRTRCFGTRARAAVSHFCDARGDGEAEKKASEVSTEDSRTVPRRRRVLARR